MLEFFQALVLAGIPELSQKKLLELLVNPVLSANGHQIHKQGRASIAKCVAALVITQPENEAHDVVSRFSATLTQAAGGQPHQQTFSLLAIGEIGKHMYVAVLWIDACLKVGSYFNTKLLLFRSSDLSKNASLKSAILESFNHPNEEVKQAASYALGNLSLGNLKEYVPFVLGEIESKPKRQYLLLHSLKEVRESLIFLYLDIF